MIYNYAGRYDEFSLESETDLDAITVALLLSANNGVQIVEPRINLTTDNILDLYSQYGSYDEYVRCNCEPLVKILDTIVSGFSTDRKNYDNEVRDIDLDYELDNETRTNLKRNLRLVFVKEDLFVRLQQLKSILLHTNRILEKRKAKALEEANIANEADDENI